MAARKKILIIEDEPHIVLGLTDALEFEGFAVVSAGKGKEGVLLARQEKPDAVLLDLMLPDTNGFKVCEELRRLDRFVPIIMLTARGAGGGQDPRPRRRRRRLRHQALQRGRAHRPAARHLPPRGRAPREQRGGVPHRRRPAST